MRVVIIKKTQEYIEYIEKVEIMIEMLSNFLENSESSTTKRVEELIIVSRDIIKNDTHFIPKGVMNELIGNQLFLNRLIRSSKKRRNDIVFRLIELFEVCLVQ